MSGSVGENTTNDERSYEKGSTASGCLPKLDFFQVVGILCCPSYSPSIEKGE